jgi:hypothetical protein
MHKFFMAVILLSIPVSTGALRIAAQTRKRRPAHLTCSASAAS